MKNRIEHSGIVERITNDKIEVRIVQSSACSSCEARKLCQSSESKEKIIECHSGACHYEVGDKVMVYGSMAMGRDAILLAFVLPLIIITLWLFVAIGMLHIDELLTFGCMVGLLTIYYLVLHMMNGKLSKRFEFWIEKIV